MKILILDRIVFYVICGCIVAMTALATFNRFAIQENKSIREAQIEKIEARLDVLESK